MRKYFLLLLTVLFLFAGEAISQSYSIVIKGGHVIDPKNKIDGVMDIAIKDNKIVKVSENIDPKEGIQVVHAEGLYVTPGLIDIHVHFFWGTDMKGGYRNGPSALPPDGFTLRTGVTTVVDAGSSGWRSDLSSSARIRSRPPSSGPHWPTTGPQRAARPSRTRPRRGTRSTVGRLRLVARRAGGGSGSQREDRSGRRNGLHATH